jgi:hypothetical protein
MKRLEKIGMQKNWIYEVVVSTFYDKNPHAAPFGVWTEDFDSLNMLIYKGSRTLKNIIKQKEFAANFIADISVFYKSLFNKEEIAYKDSKQINAPVIENSSAIIELKLKKIKEKENKFHIEAEVVNIQIVDEVRLINRAESLVLESLILATKIPYLTEERIEEALKENYRVIKKVAPDSEYQKIMEEILMLTDFWE